MLLTVYYSGAIKKRSIVNFSDFCIDFTQSLLPHHRLLVTLFFFCNLLSLHTHSIVLIEEEVVCRNIEGVHIFVWGNSGPLTGVIQQESHQWRGIQLGGTRSGFF